MISLAGKTIQWKFDDGPMAGTTIDHDFGPDGSVTWRILDGANAGATARESPYAAFEVNDRTWGLSYRAASGHTLTVILDLGDGQAFAFASNETSWVPMRGRFEIVQ